MKKPAISVCIPAYEMHGKAKELLARSFDMFKKQTCQNFEVIISDNSEDNIIKNLCADPAYQSLDIKYFKNTRKGASKNTNEAMKRATGKLIKILHMDDYLANENSLQDILDNFKGDWMVTGCGHDTGDGKIKNIHLPTYNKKVYLGKNTLGAPSVLTVRNENPLMFDETLIWLNDCDYYRRCYDKFGTPDILNKVNVIIGIGKHQTTSNLSNKIKRAEKKYMQEKYREQNTHKSKLLEFLKFW